MTERIGLIQLEVKPGDTDANLAAALTEIAGLAEKKARLAILPEMWSCGFDNSNLARHARQTPMILEKLSEAAVRHNMMIAGSLPEASDNNIYNTLYLIDRDGSLAGSYRKVHLFSLTGEPAFFAPGNQNIVCRTSLGAIGLMICYDLRFPELCRTLTLRGADMVIVSAQWPLIRVPHWNALLQARAIENQIFIAGVNCCGYDGDIQYGGHSQLISPSGHIIAKADAHADTRCAEIDFQEIEAVRKKMPCLNERMPEAYEL
jgi:predicted amidohydrolase